MSYSRRQLEAFGEPLGEDATRVKPGGHGRIYGLGGGGGTTQSTGTTYQTNIPEYARPYVETMLGATQKQLFEGTPTEGGGFDITGFKPYQAYSQNPSDYVAPFSPMQQQAQRTVAGMQVPGEYGAASDVTGAGIMGAMGTAGQAQGMMGLGQQAARMGMGYGRQATNPYATQAYMSPYMQNVVDVQQQEAIRQSGMQRMADQAQAVKAGAFGGSRQAIVEAERQRNLGTQLGTIQATGLQSAYDKAQQNMQQAAQLGMQGAQTGAGIMGQGIGAQQAAYNQAMQGAQQYANLGSQAQQAQTNIANLQNQYGAQQQAAEQQKINQAIQDWSNQQQYPLMQLGVMSNMLRGLPMQASTTNQYVAAPNTLTQGIGALGSGASIYNAFKGGAAGGLPEEFKYASGGIASVPRYDVGGEVADQLEDMSVEQLQREAQGSSSPTVRAMAKRILAQKQMQQAEVSKGVGPMGVDYQADGMAGGGIIAFAQPTEENNQSLVSEDPDVKSWGQGLVGATQSGDAAAIKHYRDKYEGAVKAAEARTAVPSTTEEGMAGYVPRRPIQGPSTTEEGMARYVSRAPIGTGSGRGGQGGPTAEELRLAAAPSKAGIMEAAVDEAPVRAPTPAKVAAPAKAAPAPAPQAAAPAVDTAAEKAVKEGDRPLADFIREREEALKAAGVEPENKAAQEQRAKLMAERANSADEEKRQKWMRMAEFFARWGSTPGPTLAAGLTAMQKSIPDLIADKTERKKANRELDKMMNDIDQAIRLEKKGNIDKASELKEKAADRGMHLQQTLMTTQATRYSADKSFEGTKLTAAAHRESAAASRENTAAYRQAQEESRKQDQYRNSLTNQTAVLAEIQQEKQGKGYLQLERDANLPETVSGEAAKRRAKAITALAEVEKDHEARISEAKNTVKYFAGRAGMPQEKAPAAQAVTVGDKTYNRPAGFTDAQWEAYKKSQGVK